MSELRVTKKQFSLKRTHDLRFSGDELQQLQCRFVESQLKSCTMSDFDQSQVFDKQSLNYIQIEMKTKQNISNALEKKQSIYDLYQKKKPKLQFGHYIQVTIGTHNNQNIKKQQQVLHKQPNYEYKISVNKKELKIFPEYSIAGKVQSISQELGTNNFQNKSQTKQMFKPIQINLSSLEKHQKDGIKQMKMVIPSNINENQNSPTIQKFSPIYRRKQTEESNDQELKNQFLFVQSHAASQLVQSQQLEKNKKVTSILLQKISELENKVKFLQQEKAKNITLQKTIAKNNYQSTPNQNQHQNQVIIKGNQITKSTQSQDNIQKESQNFRVKFMPTKNIINSENKIYSNLYNMSVSEPILEGNNLKEQIKLLKIKMSALQNTHIFNNPSIRESVSDNNQKVFKFIQSKIYTQNRKQLQGKIIKRFSNNGGITPQYNSKIAELETQNQFAKSRAPYQNSMAGQRTMQDNSHFLKNKESSSAIFRKNLGVVNQKKHQNQQIHGMVKTLYFNPSKQRIGLSDSKQQSSMMLAKNSSFFTSQSKQYPQIKIPQLMLLPHPNCSSEQLIEIGKLAFTKLGCQVIQSTVLNVKKYKNCVLFTISPQQNILWHYQGRFYFGGWKIYGNGEGQKYGKGIQFCPGKYKYKGSFKVGKRQGYGEMIFQNGVAYLGEWHQGQKNGEGRQIQIDGRIYQGSFNMNKKQGHGKIFNNGRLEFEGKFQAGNKHGYGQQHFQNGDFYQGQYLDNKFHGQGRYIWKSKAEYNGQFKQGRRNGHGVWKSSNINFDTFEGEYAEDSKNGFGIYTWANGAVYKGPFKNDLKHGQGTITYENGHTVNLIWKNGRAIEKSLHLSQTSEKKIELASRKKISATSNAKKQIEKKPANQLLRGSIKSQANKSHQQLSKVITYKNDGSGKSKIPFRSRANSMQNLKNIGETNLRHSRFISPSQALQDPPYRGMQTTTNINMHL